MRVHSDTHTTEFGFEDSACALIKFG